MRIVQGTTLKELEERATADPQCIVTYAVHTCWWGAGGDAFLYTIPTGTGHGLPCDPRGSVLMQGTLPEFLKAAKANPDHYGRHGLDAFMAAYHGNLLTDEDKPTSLGGWEQYNQLLDRGEGEDGLAEAQSS